MGGNSHKSKGTKGSGASNKNVKYKKPSCAPKRFKSAYMFFSERKHKELRQREECKKMRTADVAKLVSSAWKSLGNSERIVFLDMAKKDKERYELEKANYKGPWKVIDVKDRSAPKRPMSAFLAFSNARRKEVTEANPMLSNGEISKILSDMWREAPAEQKQAYQDEESKLRKEYKANVSKRSKTVKTNSRSAPCPTTDSESISSSAKNSTVDDVDDDDDETLCCFEVMLESLDENRFEDNISNSSRGYSVSEDTARVTLTDDDDPRTICWEEGVNYMLPTQSADMNSMDLMEDFMFDTPYQLKPLIDTDVGGFLTAAALLDGSSEPFTNTVF